MFEQPKNGRTSSRSLAYSHSYYFGNECRDEDKEKQCTISSGSSNLKIAIVLSTLLILDIPFYFMRTPAGEKSRSRSS